MLTITLISTIVLIGFIGYMHGKGTSEKRMEWIVLISSFIWFALNTPVFIGSRENYFDILIKATGIMTLIYGGFLIIGFLYSEFKK